jgi:4a-hydroxytetrahydrobiopterin dehydratase
MSDLLNKKCVPCEGGILPFDISEIHKYQKKLIVGMLKNIITTHAIEGLSENDFILAAKIDQIFNV